MDLELDQSVFREDFELVDLEMEKVHEKEAGVLRRDYCLYRRKGHKAQLMTLCVCVCVYVYVYLKLAFCSGPKSI